MYMFLRAIELNPFLLLSLFFLSVLKCDKCVLAWFVSLHFYSNVDVCIMCNLYPVRRRNLMLHGCGALPNFGRSVTSHVKLLY